MGVQFEKIQGNSMMFYLWSLLLAALVLGGVYVTCLLNLYGMFLSGLTNRVPWGIQVVLADYYIGMAVGCIVIAALYEISDKWKDKSFSRIAVYLALLFSIAAGLSMMANQGRIGLALSRSFTHFNSTSLFSIHYIFYFSFGLVCCILLYALLNDKARLSRIISLVGVLLAVALHSGTGFLFGLLPRELYRSPMKPLIYVATGTASGIGAFLLVIVVLNKLTKRKTDFALLNRAGRILALALIAGLCFTAIENIYRSYQAESRQAILFFLFGGFHSVLFWVGWILLGCIAPAAILLRKTAGVAGIVFASILALFGVFLERWLMILPGLISPPDLFPGWEILPESTVMPEGVVGYSISFPEWLQASGIFGLTGFLFLWGLKFLKLIPGKNP